MSETKPYKYQIEDNRQMDRFNGRVLLANEMGTGKTYTSLRYIKHYLEPGLTIVICPASVKYVWSQEAKKHFNLRAEILEGRTPPSIQRSGFKNQHKLLVINYDILQYWVKYLRSLKPQCIICDESQRIKSRETKRTKAAKELCRKVPYVFMLSGTPLTNRPAELWPSLNILRPDKFNSFFAYATKYCDPKKEFYGWTFKGATNLDDLHRRLKRHCMIRRRKADVLSQLPPKQWFSLPMPISPADRKIYNEVHNDFINWLRKVDFKKASRAERAEAVTRLGYLRRLAGQFKLPAVIDWIQDYFDETDKKLVIFGIHKIVVQGLYNHFKSLAVRIDGSIDKSLRQGIVDQFARSPHIRLIVGNIMAMGVGLNGMQVAQTVGLCEMPWSPADISQAVDRLHRNGQTGQVQCYSLVAEGTIEEDLCKINQEKQLTLDSVLDGKPVDGGLPVYDLLIQGLLEKGKQ
jgi:SWI/SNF-related matrix-associated actin-dependent regulator 1 of chromatin subfamily A